MTCFAITYFRHPYKSNKNLLKNEAIGFHVPVYVNNDTKTFSSTIWPGDECEDRTHCAWLNEQTIQANKRFFETEQDVPRQAYTMGIGTIMRARSILMLVSGQEKAEILRQVLQGPVTPKVPGSILRFHPDVTVFADEAALGDGGGMNSFL